MAPLFGPLHADLLALLRGLGPSDWERPTIAGSWRVRDVAAHLLDTQVSKLSLQRDGLRMPATTPDGPADLLAFLNGLNASWVAAAERFSPRVLVDLLAVTGPQVAAFVESLDPMARAPFAVAWAGERESLNWLDTGREYTEHWHHQQQIREAVGARLLVEPRWLHPVFEVSVPALRPAYAGVVVPFGSVVTLRIEGEAGGVWSVVDVDSEWVLFSGEPPHPTARAIVDEDTAWRMFFKAIPAEEARRRARFEGDRALAERAVGALAVMA